MATCLVPIELITDYIPQKAPVVMIDTVERCEGASIDTTFRIRPDNIFVEEGFLAEPGIIENIAQTAAARAGVEAKKNNSAPLPGFIGAIKDLKIHFLPEVGQVIETNVTVTNEVLGVTIIKGSSVCNGKALASCEMKIFIQQNENV